MKDILLTAAGAIAALTALIHGYLTQKFLVARLDTPDQATVPMLRRLSAMLLQYSTFSWFIGGVALIVAARMGIETRRLIILLVGAQYLFAIAGNAWASHGTHVGWMVYSLVLVLMILAWR